VGDDGVYTWWGLGQPPPPASRGKLNTFAYLTVIFACSFAHEHSECAKKSFVQSCYTCIHVVEDASPPIPSIRPL